MSPNKNTAIQSQRSAEPSQSKELATQMTPDEFLTADLMALIGRARRGDEESAQTVMRKLTEHPSTQTHLCKVLGDMGTVVWQQWAAIIGKEDYLQRESVLHQAALLRSELAGLNPSPIERLLADRIALCQLQLNYYECAYVRFMDNSATAAMIQSRIEHANRQLLSAIKALATTRKLLVPVVQVNIAAQQNNAVNIGTGNKSTLPSR